jgi:hypothetical protein
MAFNKSKKRLRWTRQRYLNKGGRTFLRAYLRVKAARGTYDKRFFSYYNISDNIVDRAKNAATRGYAAGLVPTSTLRFPVGGGSFHNARDAQGRGKALDQGLIEKEIGTDVGRRRMVRYQRAEFEAWSNGKRPGMVELIGPDNNLIVLRGRHARLPEGSPLENQHDNHVHPGWN